MTNETVETKVKRIISEQLCWIVGYVSNDKNVVTDLGADSLDLIELLMAIEDEYAIDIPDEDAEKFETMQQIIDCVTTAISHE